MLYVLYQKNHPQLLYQGGQEPIIHLEADLHASVAWANENNQRWAFTLSNAGGAIFEDRADLLQLDELNWTAISADHWVDRKIRHDKQAEFLIEARFPWHLIERIGVYSKTVFQQVVNAISADSGKVQVEIIPSWYY